MLWCAFDCARGELGAMPTPFSMSAFPIRGYSIAEDVVCDNALVQSPLVVEGRPSSAWEDYNYKSSLARLLVVTHTAHSGGVLNRNETGWGQARGDAERNP